MRVRGLLIAAAGFAAALSSAGVSVFAAPTWSTVFSQTSTTTNQLRSVALSNDEASIYVGFIQTSGNRRLDQRGTTSPYGVLNTHASGLNQPKGIVADDRGNVFVSNRGSGTTSSSIQAFSSTLTPGSTTTATTPVIGGLAIQSVGSTYYAYAVYEASGLIQRYDVTNTAAMTLDTTFGTGGSYNIPGASDLRGVEIGADGSIYTASRAGNVVYKVSADLSTVTTSPVITRAFDVALFGGNVYVTSYNGTSSNIAVLDAGNLSSVDTITISALDGNPYSRAATEGFAGIDIDASGRIWLADEHYGSTGGTQDRLLVSSPIPEPAGLALFAVGAAALAARVRRAGELRSARA